MQRTKLWLIAAVAMIIAGVVLLAAVEMVYVPRIEAYGLASASWATQFGASAAPTLQEYGLNAASMVLASVLGIAGGVLMVVGLVLLVVALVLRAISRTKIEITVGTRF